MVEREYYVHLIAIHYNILYLYCRHRMPAVKRYFFLGGYMQYNIYILYCANRSPIHRDRHRSYSKRNMTAMTARGRWRTRYHSDGSVPVPRFSESK